jgi:hypothetical protein
MTLGTPSVTGAFEISTALGKTSLGAGESTTLTLSVDLEELGFQEGGITFTSNVSGAKEIAVDLGARVVAPAVIIDNGGTGFSMTSGWTGSGTQGYAGDLHFATAGDGSKTATWTFEGLTPGVYEIAATWTAHANRATDATYVVRDVQAGMDLLTTKVNQEEAPGSFEASGTDWEYLGTYLEVTGTVVTVTLSNDADGYVIADAVRLVKVDEGYKEGEIEVEFDGVGNVVSGDELDLGEVILGTPIMRTMTVRNIGREDLNVTKIELPAGMTITTAYDEEEGLIIETGKSVELEVEFEPAEAGVDSGVIVLSTNDYDESEFTIVAGWNGVGEALIVDDGDADFDITSPGSGWTTHTGQGFSSDVRSITSGTGSNTATWTFEGLTPGMYRVSTTWTINSNRATDAPFVITDLGNVPGAKTVLVDQEVAPSGLSESGTDWTDLFETFEVTGTSLTVVLSDDANGYVIADAVRIQRVQELPVEADEEDVQILGLPGEEDMPFSEGDFVSLVGYEGEAVDFKHVDAVLTWEVEFGGKSIATGTGRDFGFVPDSEGEYEVTLTAKTKAGAAIVVRTETFEVEEFEPQVVTDLEGEGFSIYGETEFSIGLWFYDAGNDTLESFSVDWGDGTAVETFEGEEIPETLTHTFEELEEDRVITFTIEDSSGEYEREYHVEVINKEPEGVIESGLEEEEVVWQGDSVVFAFSGVTDTPRDLYAGLEYWVDVDGDGTWEYQGDEPSYEVEFAGMSPGAHLIVGRVVDQHGDYVETTAVVEVTDVAPTVSATAGASSYNEGEEASITIVSADPGNDTIGRVEIDWGDGVREGYAGLGEDGVFTHTYLAPLPEGAEVQIVVKDANGRYELDPIHIDIGNVVGTALFSVVGGGSTHSYEGGEWSFELGWEDDGFTEPEGWEINWGDGEVEEIEGNPQFVTHVYMVAGTYTPSARLIDQGEFSEAVTVGPLVVGDPGVWRLFGGVLHSQGEGVGDEGVLCVGFCGVGHDDGGDVFFGGDEEDGGVHCV